MKRISKPLAAVAVTVALSGALACFSLSFPSRQPPEELASTLEQQRAEYEWNRLERKYCNLRFRSKQASGYDLAHWRLDRGVDLARQLKKLKPNKKVDCTPPAPAAKTPPAKTPPAKTPPTQTPLP